MLRYIRVENNTATDYTIEQFQIDHPEVNIFVNSQELPSPAVLAAYDVFPLITTEQPRGDVVEEGAPEFNGTEWLQTWTVRDYTAQEALDAHAPDLIDAPEAD